MDSWWGVLIGILIGAGVTATGIGETYISHKTLVTAELGYYDSITGDFKLINLEEECKK